MEMQGSDRLRRWTLALDASIVVVGAASSPAAARCSPVPLRANATTTCTATVTDDLVVSTPGTQLRRPGRDDCLCQLK